MRIAIFFLTGLILQAGCERGPSTDAPPANAEPTAPQQTPSTPPPPPVTPSTAQAPSAPEAAGLGWKPPEVFTPVPPSSTMRKAQYRVGEGSEAPELLVHYFGPGQGGGIQQNLDRWVGQIKQADGSDSAKKAITKSLTSSGGVKVHTVDVSGTFSSNMPGQAGAEPKVDSRLLGAIAEGPQGAVFFKIVGPAEAVSAAKEGFDSLVQSIHPK